jgi:hypothetical protein
LFIFDKIIADFEVIFYLNNHNKNTIKDFHSQYFEFEKEMTEYSVLKTLSQ